jgi:NlpC/P60 family putative phage cell wall peptidase
MEIDALAEKKKEFPSPPLGERGRGEGAVSSPAVPLTLHPSPPVGERESQIVRIARSWLGTPYVHQASLKGVGCDCLGLLRGIWRELYGEEPEEIPPYSLDWAEATGAETLYTALERHCREVTPEQIAAGDIALFRMLPRGPAKHCGFVASKDLTSPNAGRSEREALRVGGALTLIHSRQNKRVSEEPLSAFWRDRLAFAFRLRG